MILTDPHSAAESLRLNLNHPKALVDGRTHVDQLNFIAEFAKLINFYDKDNKLNGNWSPFILKDPLFLVINMSKARAKEKTKLFSDSCVNMQGLLDANDTAKYPTTFNHLFDKIIAVFWKVQEWTASMLLTSVEYELKTHTLSTVQQTFSRYLWAILNLRYYLSTTDYIEGIAPPDMWLYQDYDKVVWKTNKDKQPFWEVLGQDSIEAFDSPNVIFEIMQGNGNYIFSFFESLTTMAQQDLVEVGEMTNNFPDTLLLRAFSELLLNSKTELNALTAKHLNFYYVDILKQKKELAEADSVFVSFILAKPLETFVLNKGVNFSAGLDANKNPILFRTLEEQVINPALLNAVYTLTVGENSNKETVLFLDEKTSPSAVVKDETGAVQSWDTFGDISQNKDKEKQMGIAFASPLLLMTSGERQLTVTFDFFEDDSNDLAVIIEAAKFYLSTESAWFEATSAIQTNGTLITDNQLTLVFLLDAKVPPITPYLKCPDGYQSKWPVLKIIFNSFADLKNTPKIQTLTFNTKVTGINDFSLSNDNGALNPAKPFQLFGPVANTGSAFYIGNNEIFSKPLDSFTLEINWDNLPSPNFAYYYDTYNSYLNGTLVPIPVKSDESGGDPALPWWLKLGSTLTFGLLKKIVDDNKSKADDELVVIPDDLNPPPFNSASFKVGFESLNDDSWSELTLTRLSDCIVAETDITCATPIVPDDSATMNNLFNMQQANDTLLSSSTFYQYNLKADKRNALLYNPLIQQETSTALTAKTQSGFIKMRLEAPSDGFGNSLYPQVVSMVALVNADALMNTKKGDTPNLFPAPNPPFIPTIKTFNGTYSATQSYTFDYAYNLNDTDKIIECYQYALFENYLVYNTQEPVSAYKDNIGVELIGLMRSMTGISIYPQLPYEAVLYFKLTQVLVGNQLSFYFELTETAFRTPDKPYKLNYFYLSQSGWKQLKLMSDTTQKLTCSGIMIFNLKADMNDEHIQMPTDYFWCAIGLSGQPKEVAKTTFLQTNGAKLARTGTDYLEDTSKPMLAADLIQSPVNPIPEISTIIQPFASFGGKGAEDKCRRNVRVSNRLKTKGKAITMSDYKRLIAENFDEVFYSKLHFDRKRRAIEIYLVKSVENANEKNAFLPLVTNCIENQITDFLTQNSGYGKFSVQNFNIHYLIVSATVYINSAYELESTAQRITQALKVFLSPWIKSGTPQIPIDQGVTNIQITDFIDGFSEVNSVGDVTFNLSAYEKNQRTNVQDGVSAVRPKDPSVLIVPDVSQLVKCKLAV